MYGQLLLSKLAVMKKKNLKTTQGWDRADSKYKPHEVRTGQQIN